MLHRHLAKSTGDVRICADVGPPARGLCELGMIFRIAGRFHRTQVCCSAARGSIALAILMYVTRSKAAAMVFLTTALTRHGRAEKIVTDKHCGRALAP